jgi:hypothetical protein
VVVVHAPRTERKETLIDIFADPGGERLVTTIEVLSLSNKAPGTEGRRLYLRKQREVVDEGRAHLVEIDLLRGGSHATAVPLERLQAAGLTFDYHVCVHRWDRPDDYFISPIRLADPLPEVRVPLLPDAPSVRVGLQALLARCYDTGLYARRVRYREQPPQPPLSPEQTDWADGVLRAHGL